MKLLPVLLILCSTALALGDDIKTVSGTLYKDVSITQVKADGLVFVSGGRTVALTLRELEPDLRAAVVRANEKATAAHSGNFVITRDRTGLLHIRELATGVSYLGSIGGSAGAQPTPGPGLQTGGLQSNGLR